MICTGIAINTTIDIVGDMAGKIAPKGKVKISETSGNKQLVTARQKAGSRKLTSTEANKARNSAKSKNNVRKAVVKEINSSGQKVTGGVTSTATKHYTKNKEDDRSPNSTKRAKNVNTAQSNAQAARNKQVRIQILNSTVRTSS